MNTVKLYNPDGTLSVEAQSLLSPKPADMSRKEYRKALKEFRDHLSSEDAKTFKRLKAEACYRSYYVVNKKTIRNRRREYQKAYSKSYREANKEKFKALQEANKEKTRIRREANKEKIEARKEANKQKRKTRCKAYYEANKEKIKAQQKIYIKSNPDKFNTPQKKLRTVVTHAFKRIGKNKPTNTLELLGCTWEEAKAYIESLFTEGMTWDNHGRYGWHIDHIRPVSSFGDDELHLMNRIENLQPLWWQDNLSKSDKYQSSQCQQQKVMR